MNTMKSKRNTILALLTALICLGAEPSRGSVLSDTANGMAAGTWAMLNTVGMSENYLQYPGGNGHASTEFLNQALWDSQGRKVLFHGAGHQNVSMMHIYTESTNTWSKGAPPLGTNHGYSHNAINVAGRITGFGQTTPDTIFPLFYNIDTNSWSSGTTTPGDGDLVGSFVYFPERDRWYYPDGRQGQIREYNKNTDSWSIFATNTACFADSPSDPQVDYLNQVAAYSPARDSIVFGGGFSEFPAGVFFDSHSLCEMSANGTLTVLPLAPTTINLPSAGTPHPLMTVDPVTGDILVLNNLGQMYAFNFSTNQWTLIPNHATMPPQFKESSDNVTNGFVVPIDTYGVVLYFDYGSKTLALYKHAQGGAPVTPPIPEPTDSGNGAGGPSSDLIPPNPPTDLMLVQSENPPPPPPDNNFGVLCALPTTVYCQDFTDPNIPNDPNNPGPTEIIGTVHGLCSNITSDPTKECPVFEDGAMKFIVPSNSGAGGSGFYAMRWSDFLDHPITFGEEIFVQWRQKFSSTFLNTTFQGTHGRWKQGMIGAHNESSCSSNEIVVQSFESRLRPNYPEMYHACGFSEGMQIPVPPFDFERQPGGPGTVCSYSNSQSNITSPGCETYAPDEWMTFQIGLTHGQPGQNSRIRLWVGREGKESVLAIDFQRVLRNETAGYGRLWLLPYQTNKSESQVHPVGFVYYDNIIISHTQVPDS